MKLLAVDGNSILNRAFYGIKLLTTKEGIYTNAVYGFFNILLKIAQEIEPDYYAIAFDVSRKTFRNEQYGQYKANRKGMPDELRQQLPLVKQLLADLGYTIVEKEGFEGDDIIGTLAKACTNEKTQCFIATGDRDSFQLINEYVQVRLASTKGGNPVSSLYNKEKIQEEYGISPEQFIQVKALMGDSSDNVPGVAGIGEKGALKLIREYGTLEYIYENLENLELTPSVKKKLAEGKEMAFLSRQLVTIKQDVDIPCQLEYFIKKEPDQSKAGALLAKLEMFSLFSRLGISKDVSAPSPAADDEKPAPMEHKGVDEAQFIQQAQECKKAAVYCCFNGQSLESAAFIAGGCSYITEDREFIHAVLANPQLKKTVYNAKELYLYALRENVALQKISGDILLSAYLLNPSSSDYSLQSLALAYGVVASQEENETLQGACTVAALDPLLEEKIELAGMKPLLEEIELPLSRVLAEMEYYGFAIDINEIASYSKALQERIDTLEESIYNQAGESFNINSPKQLGVILFEKLMLPPSKKTKTGYSTGAEVLQELAQYHPIVEDILKYRQLTKLKSTYTDALVTIVGTDGRIHSHFIQTETRTGRISSVEPNMQNIPVRTKEGREIRRFFQAAEGRVLIDADYSQIELRVLAHISGDENMISAFKNNLDIHAKTASEVFGMPGEFVTSAMRSRAKAVNFGIVYGIGAFSLSKDIKVSVKEAQEYIRQYLEAYPKVKQYMQQCVDDATQQGYTTTLFGRRRYIPELRATNKVQQAFGKRLAMNSPIQGTAADIIKIAMVRVQKRLEKENLPAKLILQVHDELILECAEEKQEYVKQLLKEEMEAAADLAAPLEVEVHAGHTWYEAKND